jgi:predicted nucleic acid-binding protein
VRRASWIRVGHVVDRDAVERLRGQLGRGEAESIVLARELSADYLILDDAAARRRR